MISKMRINRKTTTPAKACCLRVPTSVFWLCIPIARQVQKDMENMQSLGTWEGGMEGVGILKLDCVMMCTWLVDANSALAWYDYFMQCQKECTI